MPRRLPICLSAVGANETRSRKNTVPSLRFVVLSAESAPVIGALACLTNTLRSQRFSRPQRLSPTGTLRLCFAPHPPLGFWSSEPSSAQVSRSTSRCPLLSCRWYQHLAKVFSTKRPQLSRLIPCRLTASVRIPRCHPATQPRFNIIDDLGEQARLLHRERPNQSQVWLLSNHSGHDLHHKTARMLRFR